MRKPKLTEHQQVRYGRREKAVLDYMEDLEMGETISDRIRHCIREHGKRIGAPA